MSQTFKEVVVLREGDPEGNRMVLKLISQNGMEIHAIAVPQDNGSRTGPTWCYLFENDGLTLIDAGATGSYASLADGIKASGYQVPDIERVIITHGHQDHDGAAGRLSQEADADLWAHDIYSHLLKHNPWEVQGNVSSPLQQEMERIAKSYSDGVEGSHRARSTEYRDNHKRYIESRSNYNVSHSISEGDRLGDLVFISAPGHSPDEICATIDGIVFTGDHVLPEITPHPTVKTRYTDELKGGLPTRFHNEDEYYGLEIYLKSLKRIVDLGSDVAVLPAHRLFNKNHYNFQNVDRGSEIIDHHGGRLGRILQRVGTEPSSLEQLTRGIFARRKLVGGNLFAAMSEVVAHIELLQDYDDLKFEEDSSIRWSGSKNYQDLMSQLGM